MSRPDQTPTPRRLTGRTVLFATLGAFGVVVAANTALIVAAAGSFPGTVVKNSYVASQHFDDRRAALEASGWSVGADYADGRLSVHVTDPEGAPVDGLAVVATIGRPTMGHTDRVLALAPAGEGHGAAIDLAPGRWLARIEIADLDDAAAEPAFLTHRFFVKG